MICFIQLDLAMSCVGDGGLEDRVAPRTLRLPPVIGQNGHQVLFRSLASCFLPAYTGQSSTSPTLIL